MLSFCGGATHRTTFLWPFSHIFTKQSFHMSQWTYTALTQNDAYYPYSKQVAYHTISYFSSMFLLIKIRTASSMHSGVKQCIPHTHQIFVWKYTRVYLRTAARGRWTWFRYSYIHPHEFMYNTHRGWFLEILALYPSLLPLTQHFSEEWTIWLMLCNIFQ